MSLASKIKEAFQLHQTGKISDAILSYKKLLQEHTNNQKLLFLLGTAYCQTKEFEKAIDTLEKLLTINKDYAEAYNSLGNVYISLKNYPEAIEILKHATKLKPGSIIAWNNLGIAYQRNQQIQQAIKAFHKALKINSKSIDTLYNLGICYLKSFRNYDAITCFESILSLQPKHIEAMYSLGKSYFQNDDYKKAIKIFENTLKINSQYYPSYLGLALCEYHQGYIDKAIELANKSISIKPNIVDNHTTLGLLYVANQNYELAKQQYKKSLDLVPNHVPTLSNLALLEYELGNTEKALELLDQAIAKRPNHFGLHMNKADILISLERYSEAWEHFEWRLKSPEFAYQAAYKQPLWKGEDLKNKSIVIHNEQGIAEQITYASCLKELENQKCKVTLECNHKMYEIFKRSFPKFKIITAEKDPTIPPLANDKNFDYQIPIASLPSRLRKSNTDFPQIKSYLITDTEKDKLWKSRLNKLGNGLKVGICWKSSLASGNLDSATRNKFSANITMWKTVLSMKDIHFINLQYGNVEFEQQWIQKNCNTELIDWDDLDQFNDLDNLASLSKQLDVVIGINSASSVLANSVGTETWMIIPWHFRSNFPVEHTDHFFLTNTTYIRQELPGDWQSIFQRLERKLRSLEAEKKKK